jgi:hypothetical protein
MRNLLRDSPNCRVRVATSRTRNGLVRAAVTTDEPCESGNRLMPDLRTPIRGQNVGETSYNVQVRQHTGVDICVNAWLTVK